MSFPADRRRVPLWVAVLMVLATGCGVLGGDGGDGGVPASPSLAGAASVEVVEAILAGTETAYATADQRTGMHNVYSGLVESLAQGAPEQCEESLRCRVDLFDRRGRRLAEAVVVWADGAVIEIETTSIYEAEGLGDGLGHADCSDGYSLVFGGNTTTGFDVIVCGNDASELEYHGIDRDTGSAIRLAACETATGTWEAHNEGTTYFVDGSTVVVEAPNGEILFDDPYLGTWAPSPISGPPCP